MPSETIQYTDETADEICERVSNGESVWSVCRSLGIRHASLVSRDWCKSHPDFAQRYARALEERQQCGDDDIEATYSEKPERLPSGAIDPSWVALLRVRVDAKKWSWARLNPKRYGDKLGIGAADGMDPVSVAIVRFSDNKE
jgi:hypothetical protein